MAESVEVRGLNEVQSLLKRLPKDIADDAYEVIKGSVLRVDKKVKANFGTGPNQLKSRTGALRRSLTVTLNKSDDLQKIGGGISTNSIYAPIQENGGVVEAKNKYLNVPGGPYLNIPLSANMTLAGVMRHSARDVFNSGGYISRSRKGNWLVFSGAGVPMFVLKKSVTIPARLGMVEAAENEVPTLLSRLNSLLDDTLEG